MTARSDSIQSVERAFAVLRVISRHSASVPLAVIAEETELPKSTVSRLLSTMSEIGSVDRVGDGRYSIGAAMRAIVQPAVGLADLTALARPYLRDLVEELGEDAGLAILDGPDVLYVDQVQSTQPVQVQDWTGQRFPAHTTAAGYVLLAAVSASELDAFLSNELAKPTPSTVTAAAQLRRLIKAAGTAGHAWTHEAWAEGINGAAAPVMDADDNVVAAINLYGPAYRFPGGRSESRIASQLVEAAAQLSRHLAGPGAG